jgi:hypothetical protein
VESKRRLENWLSTYLQWTMTRLESPESYILFSGFFALSSAVRRKILLPSHYLGTYDLTPHLYVILVGPAGIVRKTTVMNTAIRLLEQVSSLTKGPNIVTQAALLARIVESEDNTVYITSTELSDLIMKSGPEMFQFLTSMFDAHKSFESTTIGRGIEFAEKPCINMIAATTPEWVAGNMPEEMIGGGFASRCIFIFEDTPRFKKLLYHRVKHDISMDKLEVDLVHDLKYISANIKGEFTLSDEAADFLEDANGKGWYDDFKIPKGSKMAAYLSRKHIHMFKLAMILHVAYSDELVLNLRDIKEALSVLDNVEPRMMKAFAGVGKNIYSLNTKSIVAFIVGRGEVSREELLREFESVAEPTKLEELINGLIAAKYIIAFERGTSIYFKMGKL